MAYNAVAQREPLTFPGVAASPMQMGGSDDRPSSMALNDLPGGVAVRGVTGPTDSSSGRLGSLIRSLASTRSSYDMVEDDDYEEQQVASHNAWKREGDSHRTPTQTRDPQWPSHSSSPNRTVPYRTASISRDMPLRHPAPDPQSLQGGYVKNVERLEESAERLSVTSSLEEELQKMKREQRRSPSRQSSAPSHRVGPAPTATRHFSSGSARVFIVDSHTRGRSDGYPSSGNITSPRESAIPGSVSQQSVEGRPTSKGLRLESGQAEPIRKSTPLDFSALTSPSGPVQLQLPVVAPHGDALDLTTESEDAHLQPPEENKHDRPHSSASNDTYLQATDLFVDFDGVHFMPHSQLPSRRQASQNRQVPLTQPPLASDPTSFREPLPGERMVYYPAPVPMMLNLPPRLSKEPAGQRERRRLQGISEIPAELRKSAAWLQGDSADQSGAHNSAQARASIPPQLRASAFFDQPAPSQEVVVKEASAVATLDSILDASAHAPVSAFTDHPIVGNVRKEVYGKVNSQRKSGNFEKVEEKRRRSSLSNMLRMHTGLTSDMRPPSGEMLRTSHGRMASRESKALESEEDAADATGEFTSLRASDDELARLADKSISPDDDELLNAEEQGREGEEAEYEDDHDMEYMRAPTTLLAELQMRKAQQKQRNRTAATAFPNGMRATLLELDAITQLQQKSRKQKHVTLAWEDHEQADSQNFDDEDVPLAILVPQAQNDINRPIGLMERRDIDDNEPLSHRRARIRGEPLRPRTQASTVQNEATSLRTLEKSRVEEDDIDEQVGETLAQRVKRLKAQKEPSPDIGTDFANEVSSQLGLSMDPTAAPSPIPDPDETLGQRRKRLKEEARKKSRDVMGERSQDLADRRKPESVGPDVRQENWMMSSLATTLPWSLQNENIPLSQLRNNIKMQGTVPMQTPYNDIMPYHNSAFTYDNPMIYSPTAIRSQYGVQYTPDPMMGPPLDPKQRIDSWRQGIVR